MLFTFICYLKLQGVLNFVCYDCMKVVESFVLIKGAKTINPWFLFTTYHLLLFSEL